MYCRGRAGGNTSFGDGKMIYFDNAATSFYKSKEMAESVYSYILNSGNPSRGAHEASLNASRIVLNARVKCAEFFDCSDFNKVVFTSGVTESLNIVINGLIEKNDHVITSVYEHNSVLRPLYRTGCELSITDGTADNIRKEIKENTKAVIITHVSNVTGDITDISSIGRLCREKGILFIVDSAQSAGVLPISMKKSFIDILCFTGHKGLGGIQGSGGLCIEGDIDIKPFKVGGSGIHSYDKNHPSEYPTRLEAGTMNVPGILSILKGIENISQKGIENIYKKEKALSECCKKRLSEFENIKIYENTKNNIGIVSFTVNNIDSAYISDMLSFKFDICTRAGAHCAPLIHEFFNEESMVRASFAAENTFEEIDIFINALNEILEDKND